MPRTPLDTAEQLACADVLHSRFTALPGSATIEDVAALVSRARRHFIEGGWARRFEHLTGAVLLGLGVRLALERR
jgi:threonine/homoserine/homoserine lactone efflux protein